MTTRLERGRDNNQCLLNTMSAYGISRRWVSDHMLVNLSTVDRWLQPKKKDGLPNASYRAMTGPMLKLFEYSINDLKNHPLYCHPREGHVVNNTTR
jgi:transposase